MNIEREHKHGGLGHRVTDSSPSSTPIFQTVPVARKLADFAMFVFSSVLLQKGLSIKGMRQVG